MVTFVCMVLLQPPVLKLNETVYVPTLLKEGIISPVVEFIFKSVDEAEYVPCSSPVPVKVTPCGVSSE